MLTDIIKNPQIINENMSNVNQNDSKQKDKSATNSYKLKYISEDNKNILYPLNYIR